MLAKSIISVPQFCPDIFVAVTAMRDKEDFIWLFTFTNEMCDQLKNSKA